MRSAIALLVVTASCAHPGHHPGHRFDDAEAWAQAFEDPARDSWQRPDEVIRLLRLAPTDTVADIGAATGYFPVRFAKHAKRVYGVDIESAMVEYLSKRADREGLVNVKAVLATADDAKLPERVDLITIVDTYHHLENRPAYFAKLRGSLAPGGRLAIIDFRKGSARGPSDAMKISPDAVIAELREAGFVVSAQHDVLPDQYFLIFTAAQ